MFCGSCGKQIPEGSSFCSSCGATAGSSAPRPAAASGAGTSPSAAAAQRAKLEAQFKTGSKDAVEAIKVLAKDPVGGLPQSFHLFDEGRALIVGGIFGVVFALATMLAASRGAGMLMFGMGMGGMGGGANLTADEIAAIARYGMSPPSTFSIMMKALLAALVFAAALMGACALARIIFKGTGKIAGDVYTAGASLLPFAILMLVGLALGPGNFEIFGIVMIFALSYGILMLYNGISKIGGISEWKAALAVPVSLVIGLFVFQLIVRALA